ADLEREAGGDHDLGGRGDVRELGLHLRAHVLELEGIDARPGVAIVLADHLEDPVDDALLGRRELASLDPCLESARASEEGVDHREHELGLEDQHAAAAQRLDLHDVEIGGDHQVREEGAVLLDLHGADSDLRVAAHEVEEAYPQVPGEAVVDDLERRHAAAHDPLLQREVVGHHPVDRLGLLGRELLAADADEEGVDLVLGQKLFGHRAGSSLAYWTMNCEKCTAAMGPVSTSSKLRAAWVASRSAAVVGRGGASLARTARAASA